MSQPLYLVIEGQTELYSAERNLPDMGWDATVRQIAEMQFANLNKIIEVGTGRDVTERMVREAADLNATNGRGGYEFGVMVELHLGTRAARSFMRAA